MAKKYEIVDQNLPFFAYGLFKPDELAYSQIKNYVEGNASATVTGCLFEKDGMVLLKTGSRYSVLGELLRFKEREWEEAYRVINDFEPFFYKWEKISIHGQQCYCLLYNDELIDSEAKNLKNSSVEMEESSWSSRRDPFFLECMEFLYYDSFKKDFFSNNRREDYWKKYDEELELEFEESRLYNMFRLQMWYVLLYSVLNRYSCFKYGVPKNNDGKDIPSIHNDCFHDLFESIEYSKLKTRGKGIRSSDGKEFYRMNGKEKGFRNFFRTARNNAVHRGKGMKKDDVLLECTFLDLYYILFNVFKKNGVFYPQEMIENIERIYNEYNPKL